MWKQIENKTTTQQGEKKGTKQQINEINLRCERNVKACLTYECTEVVGYSMVGDLPENR